MNRKMRWIVESAAMLALLVCLQWVGSFVPSQMAKQIITGTFVNCVLAVTAFYVGYGGGITVALISPVCAFFLGIAPNLITVIPIMLGNTCYVLILRLVAGNCGKPFWRQPVALIGAAVAKFGVLYLLVVEIVCGVAASALLGQKVGETVLLAPKMVTMLTTMFSWPQLVTALTGGTLALLIMPILRKALHK